jgi:Fur family ferric uptake transcriptional regulator
MSNSEYTIIYETWLERLEESGCRITSPRRAIVNILASSDHALEAVEIFDLSREDHQQMGLVTVYRTLEMLEQLGLVQRVHQAEGCHLYLRAPQGHEHILVCKACRRTDYFSGDDLTELIEATSQKSGYQIEDHWLQFIGLCARCRKIVPTDEDTEQHA